MSLSSITSRVVPNASATAVAAKSLLKLANGEYSAASVVTDPSDAVKLNLIRARDGNYASLLFSGIVPASATANSSAGVQSALSSLVLGG